MVLDRVFLSCENSVVTKYDTKVRQLALKGAKRNPGKQWPPGIDDVFIGEVAALLHVRASTQRTFPTPPLIRLSSMLSPQLGVYRTKSPFKEFMYDKGENSALLKQSFATICINTQSYDSMMNALRLCLTYGLRDTGRKLAQKLAPWPMILNRPGSVLSFCKWPFTISLPLAYQPKTIPS